MALPLYLALTAAEFQNCSSLPHHPAWMACHYSPYAPGLSNFPRSLPHGAMLILNDRTPPQGHDPELIAKQLTDFANRFQCGSILLDFQRPDLQENAAVARAVTNICTFPVGVSEIYAKELDCPVFLPPVSPHIPYNTYLSPWTGREIWLDVALDGITAAVTEAGTTFSPTLPPEGSDPHFRDEELFCHYRIQAEDHSVHFDLYRTEGDMNDLLSAAEKMGVTKAIGLWQELN